MAALESAFAPFLHPPPSSDLLLLLLVVAVVGITAYLVRHRGSRRERDRGRMPPGSVGLPVVGETLRLLAAYKTEDPEPFIDERVRRYGRLFTTHVFGERTVFSTDPEFNRFVLGGEGRSFECSYPASISSLLGAHSLLLLHGSRHRRMHALTLSRFASPAALRSSLLPDVDRLVRLTLGAWPHGAVLRLLDQAKKISFDLTVRQLMSCDPGDWTEALRRRYLLLIDGFFSLPIRLPSRLSSFTTYGRALQARTKVAEELRSVVRKRREERERKGEDGVQEGEESRGSRGSRRWRDMLEDLLEAEGGLSDDEVVDFMLALLVAGYETTSTIMTLAVKFLTETPAALAVLKVQQCWKWIEGDFWSLPPTFTEVMEEQQEIRSKKEHQWDPLEWSDYKSMPFTQCVINETLRVANIISGVFRRTVTDVDFKGYTIPKGCKVFASFRAVHLDPNYYRDARTFNPWRWQVKDMPAQHTGSGPGGAGIFTPFGGGVRLCPGYELARVEISVFLHYLLTGFSWEVAEEDRLVFFPTTRTVKGYPIKVQRRQAQHNH